VSRPLTLPDAADFDLGDTPEWERQPGEPAKYHSAFRLYRDQPAAQRSLDQVAEDIGVSGRRARQLAVQYDWRARAEAWDDACHRVEDRERLEAIRSMHEVHRKAGRAAVVKALQALGQLDPASMPIGAVARLLALGAKLERDTLIVSVEELQGVESEFDEGEDPWARIAAELSPSDPLGDEG
jgi:hypothetical protein